MEKIHGTSAHVSWDGQCLKFFSGGEKHENFVKLFDEDFLKRKFKEAFGDLKVTIFGEAYGGRCQAMQDTYGDKLKFVAFDVKVNGIWLSVPKAHKVASDFELDFVDYVLIPATLGAIEAERNKESVQAVKNGMGHGKKREGVVLRPPLEFANEHMNRVIAKHKNEEFRETKTPRKISPEKLKLLNDAKEIAEEWVTPMRLNHVLDKIPNHSIEKMGDIIVNMQQDILREGEGEFIKSKEALNAIGRRTARLYMDMLKSQLQD